MIEIELFFKIVESEIRRKHIKYLKKQKCISAVEQNEQSDEEPKTVTTEEEFAGGDKAQYVKRFNKGIDTALKVLNTEYKAFIKRFPDNGC